MSSGLSNCGRGLVDDADAIWGTRYPTLWTYALHIASMLRYQLSMFAFRPTAYVSSVITYKSALDLGFLTYVSQTS
jgi:hypothetical protein